jgi:hypothetical protein
MSQPVYSSADGYIGESFFTSYFDVALDAAHPPLASAFTLQVNGTNVGVGAITVDSANKSIKIGLTSVPLTAGDIIDFSYNDPTSGNDVNAIQGLDGTDAADFSHTIIVSTGRPGPSAPSSLALSSASDSGAVGDGVTNVSTPVITGTASATSVVKLYDTDGTTLLGQTTSDGSGHWSITSSTLTDGAHTLHATQTDGSSTTSAQSSGLALTIDTTPPAASSRPQMTTGTDTGASHTDGITSDTTPVFTGTAEANSTVTLYDTDGTTVLGSATANGSGAWSLASSALSAGDHTLTTKVKDAAGNVSLASNGAVVSIDTTGPTAMALSTTTVAQSAATNGATVATLSSTDAHGVTYDFAVGNGTIDADNGKFTISGNALVAAQNLTAGTYHIYVAGTDAAGNASYNVFSIGVSNAPSVGAIQRAGAAPSTLASSATSASYAVSFDQAVTGVDAGDFTLTSTGTATGTISSVSGTGAAYTVQVTGLAGDGTLRLDLNGSGTGIQNGSNVAIAGGYAAGQSFTLDHTAPGAPSAPRMTAGTDTGASTSDGITSNTTPVFTGTAEANSTVALYDTEGTTLVGSAVADGSGHYAVAASTLSAGPHRLIAKATDAAGNLSTGSSTSAVTIMTSAPRIATAQIAFGSSTATVTFPDAVMVGAGAIELHAQADDRLIQSWSTGHGLTASGSTASITLDRSALPPGSYYFTASPDAIEDLAGNMSTAVIRSTGVAFTVSAPSSNAGGGSGAPLITPGNDVVSLGDGASSVAALSGMDLITAGNGDDLLLGNQGNDTIRAGDGMNTVYGGFDNDLVTIGNGANLLFGNEGSDTIVAGSGSNTVFGGNNGLDPDDGADVITLGGGDDLVLGNGGDDTISLGGGNDTALGGVGNDLMTATGRGTDLLYGGEGADTIRAGDGNNTILGGTGNATVDSLDGADLITSGAGNDLILGNGGDDTVAASGGADTVVGGFGRDVLLGNQGDDVLLGNQGDDALFGGQGADTVVGGQGNDVLYGNQGDDLLYGNEGLNTFVFASGDTDFRSGQGTGDTVADFVTGTDRIDFAAGPGGSASNFGATSTTSTDFASVQAAAQALIDDGVTYAFVADGVDGFLFTTGGTGTAITDAVKLAGAGSVGAVRSTDIAHGALA